MKLETSIPEADSPKATPQCPLFGECGGCAYQHLPYAQELIVKKDLLTSLFERTLGLPLSTFKPMVASPRDYGYRHRLDIGLRKIKSGEVLMGFMPENRHRILEIEACPIAMPALSGYLPRLKQEALRRLPENYNTANLVIKTGDDGRVLWGGIGRHSLRMGEDDFFWTEISGKKIYYSLETFFQANLSILPVVIETVLEELELEANDLFLDLYSGVGLFGFLMADHVKGVVMMEDCPGSVRLARYNAARLGMEAKVEILEARVEDRLAEVLSMAEGVQVKAIIDPPRRGLAEPALRVLRSFGGGGKIAKLLYLSCYPPSLVRDLKELLAGGWQVKAVIPMDFFPRTKHLEILAVLEPS